MRITAHRVPCPICKVGAGRSCIYTMHGPRLGQPMAACHEARHTDAREAEVMANILLDQ